MDNALIKFRIRLPQELRFTSSLLVTNPYGKKQVRLRVNLFSLENRTRDLNWKVEVGTLAPWCIMVPDITWT